MPNDLVREFVSLLEEKYQSDTDPRLSVRAQRLKDIVVLATPADAARLYALVTSSSATGLTREFEKLSRGNRKFIMRVLEGKVTEYRSTERIVDQPNGKQLFPLRIEASPTTKTTIRKSDPEFQKNYIDLNISNFNIEANKSTGEVLRFTVQYLDGRSLNLPTADLPLYRTRPLKGGPVSAEQIRRERPELSGNRGIIVRIEGFHLDYLMLANDGFIYPYVDGAPRYDSRVTPNIAYAVDQLSFQLSELVKLNELMEIGGAFAQIIGMYSAADGALNFSLTTKSQSHAQPARPRTPRKQRISTGVSDVPTASKAVDTSSSTPHVLPSAGRPRFRKAGKFAKGDGTSMTVNHGTSPDNVVAIERTGIDVKRFGEHQDFGDGFYLTTDPNVANSAAKRKTKGVRVTMQWEIKTSDLGKIVDITEGGVHRKQWENFLSKNVFPGHVMTNKTAYRDNPDARGSIFKEFLKTNGLEDADTVVGPIGDDVTTGGVSGNGKASNQIAVRSARVAKKLDGIVRRKDR